MMKHRAARVVEAVGNWLVRVTGYRLVRVEFAERLRHGGVDCDGSTDDGYVDGYADGLSARPGAPARPAHGSARRLSAVRDRDTPA